MKKVNLLIVLGIVTGAGFAQDTLTISKNDLLQKERAPVKDALTNQ